MASLVNDDNYHDNDDEDPNSILIWPCQISRGTYNHWHQLHVSWRHFPPNSHIHRIFQRFIH